MAKVIYNNLIPFKGYTAITIWPLIFARKSAKWLKDYVLNHECIHFRQQLEVLVVSAMIILMAVLSLDLSRWWMLTSFGVYYTWYGLEWLIRLAVYRDTHMAYRNIAVEQEAYLNERDMTYLNQRKAFVWARYLFRTTYRK